MVSSSLHFTLTFFPRRSFSTTSNILQKKELPNPNPRSRGFFCFLICATRKRD
ncbi:hypothetical protein OIU74_019067 [Salix koriyanagi]|uniref:Uncharacterized protein n=1 Tax=Salix koriyanagi TaxID=2511006 RepID=A0A9Q1AJ61_9ROSI|nr:hypothetical protein OIU74_019067 [Salix koriyanagi]